MLHLSVHCGNEFFKGDAALFCIEERRIPFFEVCLLNFFTRFVFLHSPLTYFVFGDHISPVIKTFDFGKKLLCNTLDNLKLELRVTAATRVAVGINLIHDKTLVVFLNLHWLVDGCVSRLLFSD